MLLSAPAQGKDSSPIHGSSTRRGRHRCGHDGQRKCVAHMPTAATTTEDSRSKFGRKLPTRLHDEAINISWYPERGVDLFQPHFTSAIVSCSCAVPPE